MSEFKIGDIIKDISNSISEPYKYGIITRIEEVRIWCFWASSLLNLKIKKYTSSSELWAPREFLIKVEKENADVKVYGIVFFCASLNRRK
jgi:hypothetical protein